MMIDAIESWLTPLLFISAPALMILSTAARYAQLHGEIHFLKEHNHAGDGHEICNTVLMKRAVYFRNALVALYGAIGIFAFASLLGAIVASWWTHALQWVAVLTVTGVGAVIYAAYSLVREAMLSLRIVAMHFDEMDKTD